MVPVRIEVLGPLRLFVDEREIGVPGTKRRAVLVLLARAEGRLVGVEDLLHAVWPSSVPISGRAALQSHVSRLRGHLGPASWRLESADSGYRLLLDADALDVAIVRALRADASAVDDDDPAAAIRLLREARALWRGPVLPDLVEVEPIEAWARALDETRRDVSDALLKALLGAGNTDDVVEIATEIVTDDPLRERSVLLLVRALATAGRGRDALRAGREYRRRLIVETGLDPSPALAELEREIIMSATDAAIESRSNQAAVPDIPLVGREVDIQAIGRLLANERVVTIIGPGGVGKTRVAFEVARRLDDATTLLLAELTDPAAVPHVLAEALDLRVTHGDVISACALLLGSHAHTLVIDNCEHLLDQVRAIVLTLLGRCPELQVLLTSRVPVGLPIEHRYRLLPLAVPGVDDVTTEVSGIPSVTVFLDRARRAGTNIGSDVGQLDLVADIVRRLDGLPLAIELAAGRLSSISLGDLHARLDRSIDLLGDDWCDSPTRHRTLRSTIEWSYGLLPAHERRLFRHLAVFPGGMTLPMAEMCAAELGVPGDPSRALARLVDASMVEAELAASPTRYRMLETLRSFGLDRLDAETERTNAEERLVRWAVATARWIDATACTEREAEADAAFRHELANLRAGWHLARRHGDVNAAVTLVASLFEFATWREIPEIWTWAEELPQHVPDDHPRITTVLGAAANTAWIRGKLGDAAELARRGLASATDGEGRRVCMTVLADAALSRGRFDAAIDLAVEAASLPGRPFENHGVAALASAYRGDLARARELNDQFGALDLNPTLRAMHHYVCGEIESVAGDHHQAETRYTRAIEMAQTTGASFLVGIASVGLLTLRVNAGRIPDALRGYREVIGYWQRTGRWNQQWTTLRNLADLLRRQGDDEAAAFLDTAADDAPDAPSIGNPAWDRRATSDSIQHAALAAAPSASRAQVLDVALEAIDRCLATVSSA